jgi:hypothetical protein
MSTLKQRAPQGMKELGRKVSLSAGLRTSSRRMLPGFVLAGAQRCGTTSLFRALLDHPAIVQPVHHKGVNYFDVNYAEGWAWYQAHFPVRSMASMRTRHAGEDAVTFDASGYYIYHPHAAARIAQDLPDAKVLVMLRDPVERAFSAYRHEFARGYETESFERTHWVTIRSWSSTATTSSPGQCRNIAASSSSSGCDHTNRGSSTSGTPDPGRQCLMRQGSS